MQQIKKGIIYGNRKSIQKTIHDSVYDGHGLRCERIQRHHQ